MEKLVFLLFALIGVGQGLAVTFVLYLLEVVIGALSQGFHLPFSVWWGMVASVPGIAMAAWAKKLHDEFVND